MDGTAHEWDNKNMHIKFKKNSFAHKQLSSTGDLFYKSASLLCRCIKISFASYTVNYFSLPPNTSAV